MRNRQLESCTPRQLRRLHMASAAARPRITRCQEKYFRNWGIFLASRSFTNCWNKILNKEELEQTMKEEISPSAVVSETNSSDASHSSREEDVQRHWQGVAKRRSFLKGLAFRSA